MEISQIVGYILAIFVGITLGLIGSGGSILSVPILVYIMNVSPVIATAYSLFIVGVTAFVGGIQKAKQQLVDFKKVVLFGVPTLISVFITRKLLLPQIPETIVVTANLSFQKATLIMVVFAFVMIFASIRMIVPFKETKVTSNSSDKTLNYLRIIIQGIFIGLIAGFVGAGGGFLLIPALVFMAKTPMKMAVGTSLFIIAIQSLVGFLGDINVNQTIDWQLIIVFTILSIVGIFIGNFISKRIKSEQLKTGFGWFVLLMGIYIIIKELFLS